MKSRRFDGVELLRKFRDGEIDTNTKIRTLSASGNEYIVNADRGADKFIFDDGRIVSTGYLSNPDNKFEIIEEDKEIEKLKGDVSYDENLTFEEHMKHHAHNIKIIKDKINEIINKVNSLEKNQ